MLFKLPTPRQRLIKMAHIAQRQTPLQIVTRFCTYFIGIFISVIAGQGEYALNCVPYAEADSGSPVERGINS